jgi:hypothetical protein
MAFDAEIHASNRELARSARKMVRLAGDGPKKERARDYLRQADVAERFDDEAGWILSIARAMQALE